MLKSRGGEHCWEVLRSPELCPPHRGDLCLCPLFAFIMWVFFPTMPRLWLYCYIWAPQHWGELGVGLELSKAWEDQNVSFSGMHVMHTVCVCICMYTWFLRQILYGSGIHQIAYASCPLNDRELPPLPLEQLGYHSVLPFLYRYRGWNLDAHACKAWVP